MSRHDPIIRKLRNIDAPEPPADLLEKIHDGIPKRLADSGSAATGARWWQIAAALVLFIGGGWLAWSWSRDPLAPRLDSLSTGSEPSVETALEARSRQRAEPRQDAASSDPAPPEPESSARTSPPEAPLAPEEQVREVRDRSLQAVPTAAAPEPAPERAAEPKTETFAERDSIAKRNADVRLRDQAGAAAPGGREMRERVEGGVVSGVVGGMVTESAPRAVTRTAVPPPPAAPPSTGGTAEPNDQPYGDVFFRSYGVNPFIDTDDDSLSTFALDVDTGSYAVARRYLADGHLPPPEAIRVEEVLNAFRYGDPPPARDAFAIHAEGAPWPYPRGERYYGVRFGIRAREVSRAERKPATLVFTVDVSGSMARENRLGLVKQALHMLLDQLDRQDRIGLVVYGSRGEVLLEPTSDHDAIRQAIDRLVPAGSTNAEEGLLLAYEQASRHFRRDAINRVILCSDGVANVGRTGPGSILDRIGANARRGIELTAVGFGMGNYNDVVMEQLANRGNGQYAYVDTIAEARKIFVENLTGTLQTIARDAKVQVEFDPSVVSRYRLLGYENREVADDRFRDDSVDAGEIGAGHAVTALYEIKLHDAVPRDGRIGTIRLRYADVDRGDRVVEIERELLFRDLASSWSEASRSLRVATLVGTFGEILKRSYWAREVDPGDLASRIRALGGRDPDVAELARLAATAARLFEREPAARDEERE
ncbi:MAG TPA: von Willebrand factor type A domain-containing protein [Thermoanaerobaculia bacterium]|nr:von Willebrand factor type A domain-containing protein [Thermoanaerobaculia bacterium]